MHVSGTTRSVQHRRAGRPLWPFCLSLRVLVSWLGVGGREKERSDVTVNVGHWAFDPGTFDFGSAGGPRTCRLRLFDRATQEQPLVRTADRGEGVSRRAEHRTVVARGRDGVNGTVERRIHTLGFREGWLG